MTERGRDLIWPIFNGPLYEDARKAQGYFSDPKNRPLLAHYTSISVFDKMLENDEFWFSNPLNMNDIEEVRWGIREGANSYHNSEAIETALGTPERVEQFRGFLGDCYNNFQSNLAFDTYVLCLSEHDDKKDPDGLLSMWRGYGDMGKGVAIVFDGSPLKEMANSPLLVGKVEYKTEEERRAWFEEQAGLFATALTAANPIGEELRYATECLFGRLRMATLYAKHQGFGEEREWRIVYFPERDPQGLLHQFRSYFVGPRGVEGKLKVRVAPLMGALGEEMDFDTLVHTILLGPSHQAYLPQQSVKRMLELKGRHALAKKVKASRIPFRATGLQF